MFHSAPRDSIPSDWARSPIIPPTTHLSFCLSTWLPTLPTLSRLPPNPPTSTFNCPQLHLDSDHIRLPFLSGLCGLICPSHNSIHPAIHQIHLGLPIHPHPHSTVHNSIQTLTISVYHFCLGSVALSIHPSSLSGLRATPFTFLPFFGQTFGTPTCVCPSPMDNILSDWAWSPFIPTMTHLLAFVPFPVHPPICLPTLATPNSIRLAQILWVIHPYTLSYTLDTHCHPMAPSTQSPTIHIRRLKGHSIGLIAKPIQSMSPMLPKVAHGGLNFSWWYDKISYAPVLSAVSPFRRQAKSDFRWPIGHFCSTG